MPDEKKYKFRISAEVTGDDGATMFDANVTYQNMGYDDVCLVEGAIIKMFDGLNQYAIAKVAGAAAAKK